MKRAKVTGIAPQSVSMMDQVAAWRVEYKCFIHGLNFKPEQGYEYFADMTGHQAIRQTELAYSPLGPVECLSIKMLH